jgi:hypothetical protein
MVNHNQISAPVAYHTFYNFGRLPAAPLRPFSKVFTTKQHPKRPNAAESAERPRRFPKPTSL